MVYEYAHLVSGVWRKRRLKVIGTSRRYVKFENSIHKYQRLIGRVYRFQENFVDVNLDSFLGGSFDSFVNKKSIDEIYKKLIEYELVLRRFKKIKGVYFRQGLFVDLNRFVVHDGKSDVVIKLKDSSGYLCSLTLDKLFEINKIRNRYEGIYLIKKLKSLGITLSSDQYYTLVNKLIQN